MRASFPLPERECTETTKGGTLLRHIDDDQHSWTGSARENANMRGTPLKEENRDKEKFRARQIVFH